MILSDGGGGTSVDTSPAVGSSPRALATGTFDLDGRADAAVANYDSKLGHGADLAEAGEAGQATTGHATADHATADHATADREPDRDPAGQEVQEEEAPP